MESAGVCCPGLNAQAYKESGMKKWIKRMVAAGVLSMAVFGGTATAAWCGQPCFQLYKSCIARGGEVEQCLQEQAFCEEAMCGGNP